MESSNIILPRLLVLLTAILTVLSIVLVVIISIGLGTGLVLNRLVPSLEFGTASTIGLIAWAIILHGIIQIVKTIALYEVPESDNEDWESDDDVLSEDQVEFMADQLAEAVTSRMHHLAPRQLTKAKRRQRSLNSGSK